jgi:hypothetical protein
MSAVEEEAVGTLPTPAQSVRGCVPVVFGPDRMLSLNEAAVFVGLSRDTLRRHYAHLIRRLTPGRVGIRLRDALAIGNSTAAANTTTANSTTPTAA